jgi:rhodanese-related sulfurtransferase
MFNLTNRSAPSGLTAADAVTQSVNGDLTLIDVREHGEVAMSGKAKGAHHIPLMMLQFHADPAHPDFNNALKTDAPIAVYCASGGRSASAKQILERLGYQQVHNIGGLAHWAQAGGDITT